MSDSDTIRVPKARLREVKQEIDSLQAERTALVEERDRLRDELETLQEEHDNLRVHLTGSIREIAKLKESAESAPEVE